MTVATRPAEEFLYQLSRPVPVRDTALNITASMGIAIWPLDAEVPEQLVLRADQALHEAKRAGGLCRVSICLNTFSPGNRHGFHHARRAFA